MKLTQSEHSIRRTTHKMCRIDQPISIAFGYKQMFSFLISFKPETYFTICAFLETTPTVFPPINCVMWSSTKTQSGTVAAAAADDDDATASDTNTRWSAGQLTYAGGGFPEATQGNSTRSRSLKLISGDSPTAMAGGVSTVERRRHHFFHNISYWIIIKLYR